MYIQIKICIYMEQGSFCDAIFVSVFTPQLPRTLLCLAVCCSVSQHVAELQRVAVREGPRPHKQCSVVCYSVLQCIVVYCSVLQCERDLILINSVSQCVAVCCRVLQSVAVRKRPRPCQYCVAVCCIVLQCVAVCCSISQCVAVCCRVSQ